MAIAGGWRRRAAARADFIPTTAKIPITNDDNGIRVLGAGCVMTLPGGSFAVTDMFA